MITPADAQWAGLVPTGPSKTVLYNAHGGKSRALAETEIDDGLPDGVKKAIIAPGMKHSLKGMTQYADAGCYIIYHPEFEGVTVH